MKKYKFIEIRQPTWPFRGGISGESSSEGKAVYRIYNNKDRSELGVLQWDKRWKQYVFIATPKSIWSADCLYDVIDFIEKEIPIDKPVIYRRTAGGRVDG